MNIILAILSSYIFLPFFPGINGALAYFNPFLIIIVLQSMHRRADSIITYAVISGITIDALLLNNYPIYTFYMLFIAGFSIIAFNIFFTQKSLYSFLLVFIMLFSFFYGSSFLIADTQSRSLNDFLGGLLINLFIGTLLFYGLYFVNKKLKPFFIH